MKVFASTIEVRKSLGLREGAFAIHQAHSVARLSYANLLNRTIGEGEVFDRLCKAAPMSPLQIGYVARQFFKFINPHGHGANSHRFANETLGWFRSNYPEEAFLTDGFALIVFASQWWIEQKGGRSMARIDPVTTADLDSKLKSLGFLKQERSAICQVIRWNPD